MANDIIDWEFEATSDSDYKLVFEFTTTNELFNKMFDAAKPAVIARTGALIVGNPVVFDAFEIPERFFGTIHTALLKQIKQAALEVRADGIVVLNSKVSASKFKRQEDRNWRITAEVTGQYGRR
jgi:hypothetical protein